MWTELRQDVRYALRWLAREPGFALLATLTLALGIGANSAAFGIVNGVLLSPLPYPASDDLVAVHEVMENGSEAAVAWPNYLDWRGTARSFVSLAAYRVAGETNVLGGTEPVRARVSGVSRGFFETLAVQPRIGRTFVADEQVPGGAVAVLVGEAFWRNQLGGRTDLSTVSLQVGDAVAHVVGVMPHTFDFPAGTELWYPLELEPASALGTRTAHNFEVVGRLARGVTEDAARTELTSIAQRIRERETEANAVAAAVLGLREELVGDTRRALLVLLGASGFVLLVACTNLASALLARAARRQRELAIRASMGAHRLRLVRQLFTESLLLAGAGAVAGLVLAYLLIGAITAAAPDAIPRLGDVRVDGRVLGFTTLLAVLTALTFGTLPALRATSRGPYAALQETGRATTSPRLSRAWSVLVGTEVAVALLLLVGSGLLIRSFHNLLRVDPGFDVRGTLAISLSLPGPRYPEAGDRTRYYDELLERVRAVPGVQHAALSLTLPLVTFDPNGRFDIEGREPGHASYRVVSPGFFETSGTPVLRGRAFTDADREGALDVIVVNQRLAEQFFGDSDPIGQRIRTGGMDGKGDVWATVIGVVGDVRYRSLDRPPGAAYYLAYAQRADRIGNTSLLVRTRDRPAALAQQVRSAIRAIDADVAIDVRTYEDRLSAPLAGRRFMLLVLGAFAGVALLLSAVGIYGVVSFAVAQRTHEIGVRVALGAARANVVWVVSRSTMTGVLLGVAVGLAGAALLSRFIASMLFEVQPLDAVTFTAVAAILIATAWLAVFVPARRATRVSPMTALRAE